MPGSMQIPYHAPRVGSGRYALLTCLGKGGMSGVYGAWDTRDRTWRAVKVLLPIFAGRGAIRRRFVREGRAMMEIRNPHLVQVLHVDESEALPWMLMELVSGGSLQGWSDRNGPMPERMVAQCGLQVCQGLHAAHTAAVVHRDVKPENILVGPEGVLKVTDFGVARVIDTADDGDTRTGMTLGTLGYMAPEQLANSKHADERCDVYSVGASLYRLLTRKPVQDLFRIADSPGGLQTGAGLNRILARCLQYDPADRYRTATDLQAALIEVLPSLPPLPPGAPPLPDGHGVTMSDLPPTGFSELDGRLDGSTTSAMVQAATFAQAAPRATLTVGVGIAPTPPRRQQNPGWAGTLLAVFIGLAPAVALAIVGPIVAQWGITEVQQAAQAHAMAQHALIQHVEAAGDLPGELSALGLSAEPVDQAMARFGVADEQGRADAAAEVVTITAVVARPLGVLGTARGEDYAQVREEVARLTQTAREVQRTEAEWRAASRSPLGRIAVALGRASPPESP